MTRDDRDPSKGTQHEDSVTTPLEVALPKGEDLDAERLRPGDVLAGRFTVRSWVASGGMGSVYRAWDRELGDEVAIKTIRREIVSEVRAMERFRREISLARQVTHANVCRVFDIFHQASVERSETDHPGAQAVPLKAVTFLTMELLDGLTLSDLVMKQGPMQPEQALPIVEQMVAGLEAAHEVGVIHRDFKCSNVILCQSDAGERRAVVTDFGLARRFVQDHDPSTEITAQGEIVGSPAYMAPEQILGDKLTPATDVYALGVVLFRLVTGRLPFRAHGTMEVLAQRLHRDPPRPSEMVPHLDAKWDAAIHQCLARDPELRLGTPRDVLWALVAREEDQGGTDSHPGPLSSGPPHLAMDGSHPGQRDRSSKGWVALGLAALVCLVALGLWRFAGQPEIPVQGASESSIEASSVAVLGFKNLSQRSESEWLAIALTELLTTELASDEVVRVVPADEVARMRQELGLGSVESLAADTLRRIRLRLGSRYVVSGSYFVTGPRGSDSLRLDLRIQETETGTDIQGLSETAPQEKLLDLVQRVGQQIRPRLGAPGSSRQAAADGATMPSSLEATRLYVQGLDALRHFDGLRARDLLLEAQALDGDFPLILEALAEAYGMLGYDREARDTIGRAYELSNGLTLRERRHIEGAYLEWNADWQGAAEIYRTLFELFPDRLDYGLDLVRVQIEDGARHEAETTLTQLRALPAPERDDPRIDFREVEHALSIGLYPRAIEAAERVVEKGERIGSHLLVARAQMHLSLAQWRSGQLQQAQETVRCAEGTFLELGDRSGVAAALNRLGGLLEVQQRDNEASTALDDALDIYRELGNRRGIGSVLTSQAALVQERDPAKASSLLSEALDLAKQQGSSQATALAMVHLAESRFLSGDVPGALALSAEGLSLAESIENVFFVAGFQELRGRVLEVNDPEAAREHYKAAEAIYRRLEYGRGLTKMALGVARIDFMSGDMEAARRRASEALELSNDLRNPLSRAQILAFQARLASAERDWEAARTKAVEALQALRGAQRATSLDEAEMYLNLGRTQLALGDLDAARQALTTAQTLAVPAVRPSLWESLASLEGALLASEGRGDDARKTLEAALDTTPSPYLRRHLELSVTLAAVEACLSPQNDRGGTLNELAESGRRSGFSRLARLAALIPEGIGISPQLDRCAEGEPL